MADLGRRLYTRPTETASATLRLWCAVGGAPRRGPTNTSTTWLVGASDPAKPRNDPVDDATDSESARSGQFTLYSRHTVLPWQSLAGCQQPG